VESYGIPGTPSVRRVQSRSDEHAMLNTHTHTHTHTHTTTKNLQRKQSYRFDMHTHASSAFLKPFEGLDLDL